MESSAFLPIFSKFNLALSKKFKGTFSADTSPSKLKTGEFFIINTDVSTGFGIHWLCVYKASSKKLQIFNSLGSPENARQLYQTIGFKIPGISVLHFNSTQVQSSNTHTCGLFCVYFLIHRLHNLDLSFDELLNDIFEESTSLNEEKVKLFCTEILNV